MRSTVRISAIVPVLDEELRIEACLAALRVAGPDWEVVVVDGGSKDRTVEIAGLRGADRVITAAPGRGSQLEAGAGAASGEVLVFVHADCLLPPDAAEWIRSTCADPRWIGGAFRLRHRPDDCGWIGRRLLVLADRRSARTRAPYGDQAIFVSAAAHRESGGFPDQVLVEDLAYVRRLRRVGSLRNVPATVEVSGRRFGQRPWRSFLAWNCFPTLFRLGVSPERLARWYGRPR